MTTEAEGPPLVEPGPSETLANRRQQLDHAAHGITDATTRQYQLALAALAGATIFLARSKELHNSLIYLGAALIYSCLTLLILEAERSIARYALHRRVVEDQLRDIDPLYRGWEGYKVQADGKPGPLLNLFASLAKYVTTLGPAITLFWLYFANPGHHDGIWAVLAVIIALSLLLIAGWLLLDVYQDRLKERRPEAALTLNDNSLLLTNADIVSDGKVHD